MDRRRAAGRLKWIRELLLTREGSLTQKVVQSSIWVILMRVFARLLEFARTVILARLLAPTDFGLFGITLLVLSFMETFSETGFRAALIQKDENTESYLNTAWTVQLIRGFILAALVYILAPAMALLFDEPETVNLLRTLAAVSVLRGLGNVGTIYFRKELQFSKQFIFEFSGTLAAVVVSILIAVYSRSAWALVLGFVAGECVKVAVSFIIHPYRPRLELDRKRTGELVQFGGWVWGSTLLTYVAIHGDDLFLGKLLGATALGLYQMAYRIANLTSTEITNLTSQVMFPAYSKVQHDTTRLRTGFVRTFRFLAFVNIPAGLGIYLLVPEFTNLFLGEDWAPIIWPTRLLVVSGVLRSLSGVWGPLYLATGKPYHSFAKTALRVLLTLVPIYWLTTAYGVPGAALAVLLGIAGAIGYDCYYMLYRSRLCLQLRNLASSMLVPFVGCGVVAAFLLLVKSLIVINVLSFFVLIAASAGIYFVTSYLLRSWLEPSPLQDLASLLRGPGSG